jgi:proton-dependent oligopeptide transporter, POT family
VKFLKRRFSAAPEGTAALFFIQIFSTLGFAVLYSTLVLYATKHLQLPVKVATTLIGVFGAFNYGLHLFGGYLGGRFPLEPESLRRGHGTIGVSSLPHSS